MVKAGKEPRVKIFTLEEAEKMLPLIRRIVKDVVDSSKLLHENIQKSALFPENQNLQEARESLSNQLQSYINELNDLGVELKSIESGLIDFYTKHEEQMLYLCWKFGEDKISFWHDLESGYSGRRKLPILL